MKLSHTQFPLSLIAALAISAVPIGCAGEGTHTKNAHGSNQQIVASATAKTDSRDALLELAFQIATSIPANPHARDRARMQELVAQTCVENGLIEHAARYADKIDGWRQGEILAVIGQRCATMGDTNRARNFAAHALEVAANETDWRRERVTTEAARIYVQLGEDSKAYGLIKGSSPMELGKIEVARTASMLPPQLDAQADMFDKAIATKTFDLARGAIDGYMVWLGRVMDDEICRARALKALEDAIPGLPPDLQVTYTVDLAKFLSKHGQPDLATAKINRAAEIFTTTTFMAEDVAPLGVIVARGRGCMGDRETALLELRRLRSEHDVRREGIVDLRRAASLRALAEAFWELGEGDDAMRCYAAAIEEGASNPNARPRAEDLCATCVSMANSGIEPTSEILRRIDGLRTSLADPW